jgi:ribosomal biogenesis protein LAS1
MPHPPRVVPWRHPDELLSLRTDFYYDPTTCTQDRRSAAVSKVAAWQTRTQLPHTIESTALLTSALVADTSDAHPLHIRLGYSTAICRFVNGLLDPVQQGRFALPMHMLARNLDLPASFVEVRHAATHEALPSLAVLRTLAERGLVWLWVHYWGGLDQGDGEEGRGVERELVERVRAAAGSWRKLRRENPLKEVKEGDSSAEARELRGIVGEVVEVCRNREGVQAAIAALLEEKALIPAGKKKEKMMKGAVMLWMPLLEMVERGSPGFVGELVGGMVEVLKNAGELSTALLKGVGGLAVEDSTAYDGDFLGVVAAWVKHLAAVKHTTCGAVGEGINLEGLVKQILMQPNEWYVLLSGCLNLWLMGSKGLWRCSTTLPLSIRH